MELGTRKDVDGWDFGSLLDKNAGHSVNSEDHVDNELKADVPYYTLCGTSFH